MSEVLLSVIIPAYHSEATIKETIESIYREFESEINYEIIVVENGPEDQTTQVLEKLMCKGIPVKLFHSKQGVSNARNVGIARASGTWLMFADADDTLHPGCGKRVIEVMQTSEADLCLFGHQSGRNSRPVCDQAEICKEGSIERARIRMLQAPTRYMQVWAKLFRRHQIWHQVFYSNRNFIWQRTVILLFNIRPFAGLQPFIRISSMIIISIRFL